MSEVTTKRQRRHYKPRTVTFAPLRATAGDQLAGLPPDAETVYVIGDRPAGGWLNWSLAGLVEHGPWTPADPYLDPTFPVLRYEAPIGTVRRRVEIHRAEQWFGAGPYSVQTYADAWQALGRIIGQHFPGSTLLATPATTGRYLFLRTIPPDVEYPVLADELQQLIRSTSTQGRTETLALPLNYRFIRDQLHGIGSDAPVSIAEMFEYDATFAYAALCWQLPTGTPTHDAQDRYLGYTPARYRIRATVPRDWTENFGLFGVPGDDTWHYPTTPGETFSTWVDGAELHVAYKHAPAWFADIRILERIHWPNDSRQHEPLRRWAEKLIAARALCEQIGRQHAPARGRGPTGPTVVAALAAHAVRALLLHGIGAFQGRPQIRTGFAAVDDGANVPADVLGVRLDESGRWLIYERPALPAEAQPWRTALAHPEWCAAIWGRARARLLAAPGPTGALHRTPGTEVVAFRTDAIYLTGRQHWPDTDQVGRYRLKAITPGPIPWPANTAALLETRHR